VVIRIIHASTVKTPVTSTVRWLAATFSHTINLAILVRARLAAQVGLGGDLVGPAALVLMTVLNMSTRAIETPFAFAINWLTTSALSASFEVVLVWASVTIVHGNLAHTVDTAALILMIALNIVAGIIVAPRSNTVHRLSTFLSSALLKFIGVCAGVPIVGSWHSDLVQSALLVLVGILVVGTGIILIPSTNTIHWLFATTYSALHVAVSKLAFIPTVL
jgi:hypothetical protein